MNNKVPNYTYGVDTNDRQAIEEAYKKYRFRHRVITFFVIIVIGVLGVVIFDFYQVNFNGKLPFIALKEKVENGTLYKAIGYKVLYCDNGDKYVGYMDGKKCVEGETSNQHKDILFRTLENYLKEKGLVDQTNLTGLEMIDYTLDEVESSGTTAYLVQLKYTCLDGTSRCLNLGIEYKVSQDVNLLVSFDKYNAITNVTYFKKSGTYYQNLNDKYSIEVQDYLVKNGKVDSNNLRYIKVKLSDDYGLYKYNGVTYNKAYRAILSYACIDNGNGCVTLKKDVDSDENLSYEIAIFVDDDMSVSYVDKALVFDK